MINVEKEKRVLRSTFIQLALRNNAPLFAVPLAQYADGTGLTWLDLPASLSTRRDNIERLACCSLPRPQFFERDIALLSQHVGLPSDIIRSLTGTKKSP
jgi:hypothetical protein